jgi:hypothetical protein
VEGHGDEESGAEGDEDDLNHLLVLVGDDGEDRVGVLEKEEGSQRRKLCSRRSAYLGRVMLLMDPPKPGHLV